MWEKVNIALFLLALIVFFAAFYADKRWRFLGFSLDHNEYPMPLLVAGIVLSLVFLGSVLALMTANMLGN